MYLDQQSIDTTTSAGKLMFQITEAFAEFERSMIRTRVRAGLMRAMNQTKRDGHFVTKYDEVRKRLGCANADPAKFAAQSRHRQVDKQVGLVWARWPS